MKKGNNWFCFVLLLVLNFGGLQCYAKTIYYVKSGANGDGRSWQNASGSIQDMIDKADQGDEVWIARGTYITPTTIQGGGSCGWYYFNLKLGVSIFGGFNGVESSLQQREKKDRNKNGKIEPWEFSNETILSGNYEGKERQWLVDDEKNILEIVSPVEASARILYYPQIESESFSSLETYISGFTITEGEAACVIESTNCFVISDCEICYNSGSAYSSAVLCNKFDAPDSRSYIKNSTIHHNLEGAVRDGDLIENCVIHHNHAGNGIIRNFKSLIDCDIYANVWENHLLGINSLVRVNHCRNSEIHDNIFPDYFIYYGKSIECDTMYNSKSYRNNGYGAEVSVAYNCSFYQNYVGARVGNNLCNCKIYQNEYRGAEYGSLTDCEIYQNKGNGFYFGSLYNCHIYENEGGGVEEGYLYDCIIEKNTSESRGGGANQSRLYNCIIRDNFTVDNGGGVAGGYLQNCKVYNNESLNDGGGCFGSSAWGCSVFNNKSGGNGGGFGGGNVYNCDIYNNSAPAYGGVDGSYIYNSTIVNNSSLSGNENNANIENSIIVGTFEGSASYSALTDSYISGSGNFLATEKELKFARSTTFKGNTSGGKQMEELENANFSLLKGSSAIDVGQEASGISLPIEDRFGYPRPMGEKIDIGAHEYLSFKTLPYENKFDKNILSMNISGYWKNGKLPGKDSNYLYYDRESSSSGFDLDYVTTTFFDKTVSNKINLSFDVVAKYKTKDQQERMHIILAYLDSDNRDTIMTYSNTDYTQELHFSKEISAWVNNRVFRVLFAKEKQQRYHDNNTIYWGITNLSISKQDATIEIIAEDKICMYDKKIHIVDFQIKDSRVDKNKAIVTYQRDGETTSTTNPPINVGVYQARISIEDGVYFGMKEVTLTIEKAYQEITWEQQLKELKTNDKISLKATTTSGLDVLFESDDTDLLKVEKIGTEWWAVANTIVGYADIKAYQEGNSNYNRANSLIKTIQVVASDATANEQIDKIRQIEIYPSRFSDYIQVCNLCPEDLLYLFSSSGKICKTLKASGEIETMDVSSVGSGIYYLCVMRNGVQLVVKTVIKN